MRQALPSEIPMMTPNCGASRCHPIGVPTEYYDTIACTRSSAATLANSATRANADQELRNRRRAVALLPRIDVIIHTVADDATLREISVIVISRELHPAKNPQQ